MMKFQIPLFAVVCFCLALTCWVKAEAIPVPVPPSQDSLSGTWAMGQPDVKDFPVNLAPQLTVAETHIGLTLKSQGGTFQYTRVPDLPNMFKISWTSSKPEGPRPTLLIKVDSDTLVEYDSGHFIYLRRVKPKVPDAPQPLDPSGVWAKGPPNTPTFDVSSVAKFSYLKTDFGLMVRNVGGETAIWHKDSTTPNVYVGRQVLGPDGQDRTPPKMSTWRLTQLTENKMILHANGAVKHLVRAN